MRKADQGILGVPVRIVRREDCALQALQADFASLCVQGVRKERAVSALASFCFGVFEVLIWDKWQ